ncbi:MAG: DUF1801 domain-containing protein [Leeuwenhoekiella sp.]
MSAIEKLEAYFKKDKPFKKELFRLREIMLSTELEEDYKWNAPIYTINGKNVAGIGGFKNHFGVWFFNGALLKDESNLLVNAQEGKTKALRQIRFTTEDQIDESILKKYLEEAIENQKDGKIIKTNRASREVEIPSELNNAFILNHELKVRFEQLTPGRQHEYAEYISGAKQGATRITRLDKCIPMIMVGIGLNDKYKNC